MLDIASHIDGIVKEGVLSNEEIAALELLFKRFGFSDAKTLSSCESEAREMLMGLSKLQEIFSIIPDVVH